MINILLLLTGAVLGLALMPKNYSVSEKFIIGWSVVLGIVNLLMTVILLFKPIEKQYIILPLIIFLIMMVFLIKNNFVSDKVLINKGGQSSHLNLVSCVVILLIVLISITIVGSLVIWPVQAWDSVALYDFRAKFFFLGNQLKDLTILGNVADTGYYLSYPLFTSNLHLLSYLDGIRNPQWIYILFSLGTASLLFNFLNRNGVAQNMSLFLMLLFLLTIFSQSIVSYSNLPYQYYVSFSIIYLYDWLKSNSKNILYLSVLMTIFSAQVRTTERFYIFYMLILIIVYVYRKRDFLKTIIIETVVFMSSGIWPKIISLFTVVVEKTGKSPSLLSFIKEGITSANIGRIAEVFLYFVKYTSTYWIYYVLFVYSVYFHIYRMGKRQKLLVYYFPAVIILFILFMFSGTYFYSFVFPGWSEIGGSLTRSFLTIIPVMIVYFGIALFSNRDVKLPLNK